MEKINDVDYLHYEETLFGRGKRKGKGKEKGPPTKSDKERRKQEIQAARQARVEEVEKRITKHLSLFPQAETDEGQKQVQSYIEWLKDSLELRYPRLNPEDENEVKIDSFLSSVRAGGKMKEVGTLHWISPNTGATNESGFTALPAGCRLSNWNISN